MAMRFLSVWTPDPKNNAQRPTPEMMATMGRLVENAKKSGELVDTGGLNPLSMGGARLESSGGRVIVTDGPFAEANEVAVGWAILEAPSLAGAIESAKRFMAIAGDGVSVIRKIAGPEDMGPPK
jgi:hypothetical protein